jgi:hypothetical protein
MKKVSLLNRIIDRFKTKRERPPHHPLPFREINDINDYYVKFNKEKLNKPTQNDTIAKNK